MISIKKNTGKNVTPAKSTEFQLKDFAQWENELSKAGTVMLKISGNQSHLKGDQTIKLYQIFKQMTGLNNVVIKLSETASTLDQLEKIFKHTPSFIKLHVFCRHKIWGENFNFIDAFKYSDDEYKFRQLRVKNISPNCFTGYNIKKLEAYNVETSDVSDFEANLEEIILADTLQFSITLLDQSNKRAASFKQIFEYKERISKAKDGSEIVEKYAIFYSLEAVVTTWNQCKSIIAARQQRNFINHFDIRVSTDINDSANLVRRFWKEYRLELKKTRNYNVDHIYTESIDKEKTLSCIEQQKEDLQATFVKGKFFAPLTDAKTIKVYFEDYEIVTIEVEDEIIIWLMSCVNVTRLEIHGKILFVEKIIDRIQRSGAKAQVEVWTKLEVISTRFNDNEKILFLCNYFPSLFDMTLSTINNAVITTIKNTANEWKENGNPQNRPNSHYMAFQFINYNKIARIAAALKIELGLTK